MKIVDACCLCSSFLIMAYFLYQETARLSISHEDEKLRELDCAVVLVVQNLRADGERVVPKY